jgi:hypothetical protein
VESVIHGGWNGDLIELNEQVIVLVDTEARGVGAQRVDIFGIEMEVASSGKYQPVANFALQALSQMLDLGVIESVFIAAMRRGDNVCDAVTYS